MKFSIIVPVYNVEDYLKQCLDSIVNQKFEDYEILLVNDGTKDNSGKICEEYSSKYNKIKYFIKKNGGLSDARNYGINRASGEYLIFVDSDDWIDSDEFLDKVDKLIQVKNPDLIVFGRKKYYEKNNKFESGINLKINSKYNVIENMIKQNFFKATAWDKIIKRKIIIENNIFFPVGVIGEDIQWCAEILKYIDFNKISYINDNLYIYRQRKKSICDNLNEKDLLDIFDMIEKEIILKEESMKEKVINSYLAYEYIVRLGRIYSKTLNCKERKLEDEAKKLRFLFKYTLSNKVRRINYIYRICGYNSTSRILGYIIDVKSKKR